MKFFIMMKEDRNYLSHLVSILIVSIKDKLTQLKLSKQGGHIPLDRSH